MIFDTDDLNDSTIELLAEYVETRDELKRIIPVHVEFCDAFLRLNRLRQMVNVPTVDLLEEIFRVIDAVRFGELESLSDPDFICLDCAEAVSDEGPRMSGM